VVISVKKIKGFTLIELIVVIAIISVLTSLLIVNMASYIRQAQVTTDVTNAKEIYNATQLIMMLDPQAYDEIMGVG
jgi:type IV pilus assembly protein PilA